MLTKNEAKQMIIGQLNSIGLDAEDAASVCGMAQRHFKPPARRQADRTKYAERDRRVLVCLRDRHTVSVKLCASMTGLHPLGVRSALDYWVKERVAEKLDDDHYSLVREPASVSEAAQ